MTLNKKILAAAIVGGLFATAAQAQVNLSATGGSTPVTYASELIVSNPTTGLDLSAVTANELASNLRYNFSANEVRYVRVECASNIRFAAGTTVALAAGGGVAADLTGATIGSVNGIGTNVITFSVTSGAGLLKSANQVVIGGPRNITSATGGACSYSLYDQPSQAAAGGAAGLITTISGSYLTFARSYGIGVTALNGATASVTSSPSFSRFVVAAPTNVNSIANLGTFVFDTRANVATALGTTAAQPLLASGAPATLGTVLAGTSSHTFSGDFSLALDNDGAFDPTRVFISSTPNCAGTITNANAVTATTATFNTGANSVTGSLCYAPRSGAPIPVSSYSQTFNAASFNPATLATTSVGPVGLGSIGRDGTSLQAPFVQVPAGWLSRVVLTNTGSVARPYTFSSITEAGVTATAGPAATGSIPANGTIVLNVADITTFTGATRGTLNVSIAAPSTQVQGLYQIVNGATGSISNHVMVRPNSN